MALSGLFSGSQGCSCAGCEWWSLSHPIINYQLTALLNHFLSSRVIPGVTPRHDTSRRRQINVFDNVKETVRIRTNVFFMFLQFSFRHLWSKDLLVTSGFISPALILFLIVSHLVSFQFRVSCFVADTVSRMQRHSAGTQQHLSTELLLLLLFFTEHFTEGKACTVCKNY